MIVEENKTKISVITICKDAEKDIENTIKSVINQTKFENIEYIIIDGASTDKTIEIIENYKEKIAYFVSEPDKGIYNAMNKGIKAATGDFLIFLNAGDFYINELVFEQFLPYLKKTTADLVIGNLFAFNKYNADFVKLDESFIDKFLFNYQSIPHPASFFRRNIFEKVGLYNENHKIVSDFEWYLKYFNEFNGNYLYVDKYIAFFDLNGICSNKKFKEKHKKERSEVLSHYFSPVEKFAFTFCRILFPKKYKNKFLRKILAAFGLNKIYTKEPN